jgi:hypothetical protein
MLNIFKMLIIVLFFTLLMPFGLTQSFAYGHGSGGFHGGGGYHGYGGYGNFGGGFNYSPYYYNPYYYPYYPDYYDTGVILSSPVVETPEIIEQPAPTVVTTAPNYPTTEIVPAQTTTDTDNEITINIPNSAGGYTSVLMKRSGNGFVGPQGEFYSEFPKVSVLKAIYGK